jgi:hypothetical protein
VVPIKDFFRTSSNLVYFDRLLALDTLPEGGTLHRHAIRRELLTCGHAFHGVDWPSLLRQGSQRRWPLHSLVVQFSLPCGLLRDCYTRMSQVPVATTVEITRNQSTELRSRARTAVDVQYFDCDMDSLYHRTENVASPRLSLCPPRSPRAPVQAVSSTTILDHIQEAIATFKPTGAGSTEAVAAYPIVFFVGTLRDCTLIALAGAVVGAVNRIDIMRQTGCVSQRYSQFEQRRKIHYK